MVRLTEEDVAALKSSVIRPLQSLSKSLEQADDWADTAQIRRIAAALSTISMDLEASILGATAESEQAQARQVTSGIQEFLQACVERHREFISERRLEVVISAEISSHASNQIVRGSLGEIVDNLFLAAVCGTPEGGAIVLSSRIVTSDEKPVLRISVSNSSSRATRSGDNNEKHSGHLQRKVWGVCLMRAGVLVEEVGGAMIVKSNPKIGVTTHVLLPLEDPLPVTNPSCEKRNRLRGKRLLVVDDVHTNRIVLSKMLQKFGGEVAVAHGGKQGINMATDVRYDLIFLDINMPDVNGVEVFQALRHSHGINQNTKIIAYTTLCSPEEWMPLAALGFSALLAKPIQGGMIDQVLDAVLE